MADLHIPLKRIYFEQIRAGEKPEEYRPMSPHWRRRLEDRTYDLVVLTLGYPRSNDTTRRLVLPWRGYSIKRITHTHFGQEPVMVYAINVAALPGTQWQPSNGTVGHSFIDHECGSCQRNCDDDCRILARSFIGEAVEWRTTADGECFCTEHVPLGEPLPQLTCARTLPLI